MATVIDNIKRGKKGLPEKGQMVIDNGSIEWRGEKDGTKTLANVKGVGIHLTQPGTVVVTYGEPQQQELFIDFRKGALKVQGQAKVLEQDIRNALGLAAAPAVPSDPVAAGNFQRMAAQAEKSAGAKGMIFGAIVLAVGIGITVVTYGNASSSPSGGSYIVAWGPMLFGFIAFVQGLFRFVKASGQLERLGGSPVGGQAPPPAGPPVAYPPPAAPSQPASSAPAPPSSSPAMPPPSAPPPAYPPPSVPPPTLPPPSLPPPSAPPPAP
jgi:hypothetical protein